jgi:superoxide dismutase, Fe-Mn family
VIILEYKFVAKTFDFRCVQGITDQQLQEHYKLYTGYINKMNEIRSKLPSANRQEANSTYSQYRCLKKGETFALNAVKLHELYFENLCALGSPSQQFIQAITKSFGSMEKWLEDLKACGKAARGWAVTAFDPKDGKFHNFLHDAHDQGPIWFAYPVVVLDVYEHAYFMDFGTDKDKYIDVFIKNINWNVVNLRMEILLSCYPEVLR